MFKKRDDNSSKEKKIEVVSKNNSGFGFKKKVEVDASSKITPKRIPLKEEVNTSRSFKKDISQ